MLQTLLLITESDRINGLQMFIMSSSHLTGATYISNLLLLYRLASPENHTALTMHRLATDHHTDMYSLPPFAVAYELLQHVLETVNDWMPMLPFGFEGQARMYYATPWQVSNIWLATLNLVLALGARHSSLLSRVGQTVHEGTLENTRYLGRAWSCLHSKILRS
jgi:hypothetical protein